ncbi:MAG TPA: LuxR C-terminal-related transcriptional regulator [Thermomicrobiales bacterium]
MSLASLPASRALFPTPRTSLVGRASEVAAARDLLVGDNVPLLTLTGPGGVGKTRLALAVAHDVAEAFADGGAFVDLSPIRDPDLVLSAIAQALGIVETDARSIQAGVAAFLRPRQVLLVLDNFEQVLPAAPTVAELLAACPAVQLLVTSRAALRVFGEQEFPVPPLILPDPTRLPSLAELAQTATVTLFLQRARAVNPGFALTEANAAAVAEVCRRLDGLPLAIELAAARAKVLSPRALLTLLNRRLQVLTGGSRDAPARQRTLRDAIAWSYDQLSAAEQALFRSLAVFVGGCTLEAAEAVCGPQGSGGRGQGSADRAPSPCPLTPDPSILDGIAALVDNSLLRQESGPDGEMRFSMLETIREFALERLELSGQDTESRTRHAAYFLALAESVEPHLMMPGQESWLARLAAEHDNLRAALGWLERAGKAEAMLRLTSALSLFWFVRSHFDEGRGWLERALALGGEAPVALRAKALVRAGYLAIDQGDARRGEALIAQGLALWRDIGDREQVAASLYILGNALQSQGRYDEAQTRTEEALALYDGLADGAVTTVRFACNSLASLGRLAYARGEYARAEEYVAEALARQRSIGDDWAAGSTIFDFGRLLGRLAQLRGDLVEAAARYRETLSHAHSHGDPWLTARALVGVADVVLAKGRPERAARVLGAVAALDERVGGASFPADRDHQGGIIAAARVALGEGKFAAAWSAGRALPSEQAVAEALVLIEHVGSESEVEPAPAQPAALSAAPFGLSQREREVLALLIRRDTAPEIAGQLCISVRTVERHVESIYRKLGVNSRREAAAVALRCGLA